MKHLSIFLFLFCGLALTAGKCDTGDSVDTDSNVSGDSDTASNSVDPDNSNDLCSHLYDLCGTDLLAYDSMAECESDMDSMEFCRRECAAEQNSCETVDQCLWWNIGSDGAVDKYCSSDVNGDSDTTSDSADTDSASGDFDTTSDSIDTDSASGDFDTTSDSVDPYDSNALCSHLYDLCGTDLQAYNSMAECESDMDSMDSCRRECAAEQTSCDTIDQCLWWNIGYGGTVDNYCS